MKVRKLRAKYLEAIFEGKKKKQKKLWYKLLKKSFKNKKTYDII